jgi:hypothetical protein
MNAILGGGADTLLKRMKISDIEKYLRKIKLEKIVKKNDTKH